MNLLDLYVKISAKDEASDEISQISQGITGKLSQLGGVAAQAAGALSALWATSKVVEFGKAAFDAYSQFEQLEGGVAKLYGNAGMSIEEYADSVGKSVDKVRADYVRNAEAQELVMKNAQQAWKTAGMDANSYMEMATSFSASLINSLGGDTKEAANLTDEAMKAMSDNVNTFGSDMGSVQNAFQGFAKQNYTMLDNLKLGYGGTKEEMARLIQDAASMEQEQKDLNMTVDAGSTSFDNIVKAIQVVQKHQGIYGTTSREAMNTIEGSMNATKAAWQNLVAEIGKPDADIGARISDMMNAVMGEGGEGGLLRNVANEVKTVATNMVGGIATLVEQGIGWIVENGPSLLKEGIDALTQALTTTIPETISTIHEWLFAKLEELTSNGPEIVDSISSSLSEVIDGIATWLIENGPTILEAAGKMFANLGKAIVEHGPDILMNVGQIIFHILEAIGNAELDMVGAAIKLVAGLITGSTQEGEKVREWFASLPQKLIDALGDLGNLLMDAGKQIIQGFLDGAKEKFEEVKNWVGQIGSWIQNHKGPKQYDLNLLVKNGQWIMKGLQTGLEKGLPSVEDTLSDITGSIQSGISTNVTVAQSAQRSDTKVLEMLASIRDNIGNDIYLNSDVLVGQLAAPMNTAMGRL